MPAASCSRREDPTPSRASRRSPRPRRTQCRTYRRPIHPARRRQPGRNPCPITALCKCIRRTRLRAFRRCAVTCWIEERHCAVHGLVVPFQTHSSALKCTPAHSMVAFSFTTTGRTVSWPLSTSLETPWSRWKARCWPWKCRKPVVHSTALPNSALMYATVPNAVPGSIE